MEGFTQNLKIKASAGTGKTYTIRKISADLVAKEKIPLTRVLFVTYTEKAAGELRDRIRKEMEECYAKKDENYRLYERACQDVDIAMIGTIHSFCRKTLHDFAYESNMPVAMSNIDDAASEGLINQLIRDEWEKEICSHVELYDDLDAEYAPNDSEKKTINDLLTNALKSYQPGIKLTVPPSNFFEWVEANPEAENYWKILCRKENEEKEYVGVKHNPKTDKKMSIKVPDFCKKISSAKSGVLFDVNSFGHEVESAPSAEIKEALDYFYKLQKGIGSSLIGENESILCKFLMGKIPDLYKRWQKEKADKRVQSFNDMIYAVREAVCPNGTSPKEPTPLCKKIRDTYDIAIIDEFQDTNALQWDIFKTVFLEDNDHGLIVVGDPKQSIYSFQGADLNVYNSAIDCIDNSQDLGVNFRSSKAMIKACNTIFSLPNDSNASSGVAPYFKLGGFTPSGIPSAVTDQRQNAELNGVETEPVWISPKLSDRNFARFATRKIVECCKVTDGRTALQIYDRGSNVPKNVSFNDFAILVTKRSESTEIKKCLAEAGIPFLFYKDTALFNSRECSEWLAILKLLIAPNLSGYNQKLLKSALVTDFFRIGLNDLDDSRFDKPSDPIIQMIDNWRNLGERGLWTELQEEIYEQSKIESFLSDSSHLQELARLRQIGNYVFTYLYEKRASLHQVIRHLEGLISNSKKAEDEDGNIVAKGTDFDAVRLMTVHASKGLEFPVVISCAGLRELKKNPTGPFLYDENNGTRLEKKLGFDKFSKRARQNDEVAEWHRLLYVDYTRASSLLILPQYENWYKDGAIDESKNWAFLAKAHRDLIGRKDEDGKLLAVETSWDGVWNVDALIDDVQVEKELFNKTNGEDDSAIPDTKEFKKTLKQSGLYQHSYSSIAHNSSGKNEILRNDGSSESDEDDAYSLEDQGGMEDLVSKDNYPKGTLLGNAIHHIFEKLDFERIGEMSVDDARKDVSLRQLVEREFIDQSLPIKNNPSWVDKTIDIVWNTLNANIPEVVNAHKTGKTFQLKQIPYNERLAEMDFRMDASRDVELFLKKCSSDDVGKEIDLSNYYKGSMDLVFAQNIDGETRYSVLDWKTNLLPVYDEKTVKNSVFEKYSIQLVLYSYCLVQWLHCIFHEKSLEDTFNKYFGGVYYVFVRGCESDRESGVYAHLWENFGELQKGYEEVVRIMVSEKGGQK